MDCFQSKFTPSTSRLSYFNEPCTTGAVNKKNWQAKFLYANLAHDFRFFFVSFFERDLIEHHFFGRK